MTSTKPSRCHCRSCAIHLTFDIFIISSSNQADQIDHIRKVGETELGVFELDIKAVDLMTLIRN